MGVQDKIPIGFTIYSLVGFLIFCAIMVLPSKLRSGGFINGSALLFTLVLGWPIILIYLWWIWKQPSKE